MAIGVNVPVLQAQFSANPELNSLTTPRDDDSSALVMRDEPTT